ncbi:MAG: nucleoside-diphosphate-sugar epimerase [Candidatus Omnitrophota bacterium]|jgi:nucleoside-diphosphate-sugar epimerase
MRCLITGSPGWMGTQLAARMLESGAEVRCLVQPSVDVKQLESMGVKIVRGDIRDQVSLKRVCEQIDLVFHCAGIIHPKTPKDFFRINTVGTQNLAEEAIKSGVRRFVYVSSSSAGSGYSLSRATRESDTPRPYKQYGRSKLMAEQYLLQKNNEKKIEIVIIRPHFLYGPAGPLRQLKLIQMMQSTKPILFGDGKTKHSLCHIHNCIDALYAAAHSSTAPGRVYYIADKHPYSTLEIYHDIATALGIRVQPRLFHLPKFSTWRYACVDQIMQGMRFYKPEIHLAWDWSKSIYSDISRASEELSYTPTRNFLSGISEAVKQYRAQGLLS